MNGHMASITIDDAECSEFKVLEILASASNHPHTGIERDDSAPYYSRFNCYTPDT
jgi:hypothetical protein